MGSKARHAKHIIPVISEHRICGQLYVEPFVGGGNVFHLVDNPKWGNDLNGDVVACLNAVGRGWVPPGDVSEAEYHRARFDPDVDAALRGFIGIGCSYAGKFFGGYARGCNTAGVPRNYARESRDNLMRQAKGLAGSKFTDLPYWEMDIPAGSVVYCDPPYRDATGYYSEFDSDKFWEWCRGVTEHSVVLVSEYAAPPGWDCVWSSDRSYASSLTADTGAKRGVERLFMLA